MAKEKPTDTGAPSGASLIMVPGYREMIQVMLAGLKAARARKPVSLLPAARFEQLVASAESHLRQAAEIEGQALHDPLAREAYQRRCDVARLAIFTAHDEPLARTGAKRHAQLADFGRRKGSESKAQAAEDHAAWQAEAARIWAAHPTWGKLATATQVVENLGLDHKPDTVSRAIRKPPLSE